MTDGHFLWPRPKRVRALIHAASFTDISEIEQRFSAMFSGGTPVLFSSGRAALVHALLIGGYGRGDKVGVFPFASHCVLDAVSRVATPAEIGTGTQLNVIFQQWGFIQHHDLTLIDIEDCVDSLLVPGGRLFPGGGGFELWSLPKIVGTTGGAVLWCRSDETALALRQLRDKRQGANLLWILRLLGTDSALLHAFWEGAEASYGRPSRLQLGEILVAIQTWKEIVEDRQKKLDLVWPMAPSWLQRPEDRLPCVVPVELSKGADGGQLSQKLGLSVGQRMIEKLNVSGNRDLVRVLPIPIHQDISLTRIDQIMAHIRP
jgi:putative PLP-dependent aminotransferase (TIGR04422 family)